MPQPHRAKVAAAFNVSDPSTITVSCRFNVPTSDQPILRRMMRAVSRLVQTVTTGTTPADVAVETSVTVKLPVDFPAAVASGCAKTEGLLASDVSCDTGSVTTKPSVTVSMSKSESVIAGGADPCTGAVSESANLLSALARDAGSSVNSNTLRSTGCKSQRVAGTTSDPNAPGATPVPGGAPGTAPTPGPSDSPSSASLSSGAIAGIVIGAVAGAVLIGFVGIAVRNKMSQRSPVTMVGRDGTTRTTTPRGWARGRWMTYSMQEKAEQARSGSAPVAGVSTY